MRRIASINQDPGIGPGRNKGAAVHLASMRKAFAALGYDVTAVDEPDGGSLERALRRQQGSEGLTLIYERYALGADRASRFARRHGIPVVLEVNAPLAQERARYRKKHETSAERERDRFVFANATLVVTVSSGVAEYARERGAAPERILVCPNGVDRELFNLSARASKTPLPGIAKHTTVLGFHGRERPWHGFGELVRVAGDLLERGHDIHFLVVGEGAFEALQALPPSARTRLPWQPQERLAALLAHFDILPLAHRRDAPYYFSPLKLTEAMACGAVPVVPDLGDLATLVRHGQTGFVYPAGQPERLAELIGTLCSAVDERKAVGERAAAWASRQTWNSIARRILSHPLLAQGRQARERAQL
jgi:glycosyltransferase involved in cell wall biosynthesis